MQDLKGLRKDDPLSAEGSACEHNFAKRQVSMTSITACREGHEFGSTDSARETHTVLPPPGEPGVAHCEHGMPKALLYTLHSCVPPDDEGLIRKVPISNPMDFSFLQSKH